MEEDNRLNLACHYYMLYMIQYKTVVVQAHLLVNKYMLFLLCLHYIE